MGWVFLLHHLSPTPCYDLPTDTYGDRDMKTLAFAAIILAAICSSTFAAEQFKVGQKAALTEGGWVCHSLEKAIASRIIGPFDKAKESEAIYQLNNGSCINYSIRPLKVLGYEDYLIPGYTEKGKLFVSVREPRSGDVWYAYTGYLKPSK